MSDAIKRIREALAAGPTPGPWTVMPANAGEQCVARINAWESVPPNGVELAHDTIDAAFIAACNPAAIRELLAEHDALKADAERLASLAWPEPFCDEYNGIDLHEQASIYASALGREEPNRDDYLAALRCAIDAARGQA